MSYRDYLRECLRDGITKFASRQPDREVEFLRGAVRLWILYDEFATKVQANNSLLVVREVRLP
jgi:hypothetical protein